MEVGRRLRVARVGGDEARGNVQRAAQRDHQVREVAADAGAVREHVARAVGQARRTDDVVDVVLDPLADRLHAAVASRQRLEPPTREREDRLDLAVAARLHVREHRARHLRERHFGGGRVHRRRVDLDRRQVADVERAPRHVDPEEAVAPAFVPELVAARTRRDRHALGQHPLRGGGRNGEIEDEQRLREDVVVELAVDVEGRHRAFAPVTPLRENPSASAARHRSRPCFPPKPPGFAPRENAGLPLRPAGPLP